MATFVLAVLALGVAGLDPLGALLAAAALAAGATRKGIWSFTIAAGVTTVVIGTIASLALEPLLDVLGDAVPPVPDDMWLIIDLVLVALLLLWGIRRIRRGPSGPEDAPRKDPRQLFTTSVLLGAGVVFALSALTDPAYYAVIVLAGRAESLWPVIIAHVIWFAVSQSPLLGLSVATLTGGHERVSRKLRDLWDKGRPLLGRMATAAILLVAIVLLSDAFFYLVTGDFLLG